MCVECVGACCGGVMCLVCVSVLYCLLVVGALLHVCVVVLVLFVFDSDIVCVCWCVGLF